MGEGKRSGKFNWSNSLGPVLWGLCGSFIKYLGFYADSEVKSLAG